ncbi:8233_t:CDS:2, partial [Racocetra fulgida]
GVYQETPYPDKARKLQLAAQIGATDVQVNEWFQRRRKKDPSMISNRAMANSNAATNTALNSHTAVPPTSTIITIPANLPTTSPSTSVSQGHANTGTITSPYFSSYTSHVNPPIPNHEVYVYIGDNQAGYGLPTTTQTVENISEKQEEPPKTKLETDNSRELVETIMPYLKDDFGLISSEVVHDFLHKVKDTPLSERRLILHIIDQTKDSDTLKSLVSERAHYLLRNWIIDEAKTPDSELLLKLLQTVNHLPIDIEALSASGLGKVINNKSVKDSQIDGVSALASLLISKWKEEKKQHDAKLIQEAKQQASLSNFASSSSKAGMRSSSTPSKTSQTNPSTSKVSKGKEVSTRIKLLTEPKTKEIDPKLQARPDTNTFDEILGLNAIKPVKQVSKVVKKEQQKPTAVVKVSTEKQDSLTMTGTSKNSSEVIEDNSSSIVKREQENGQSSTIKEAKKDVKEVKVTTSKKRKRVTFAPDNMLTQVKLFEEEYDEAEGELSVANTPHQFGNARDLDRNEGLAAFKRVRKAPAIQWYTTPMLDLTSKKIIKPAKVESEEAKIQEEREREIFETIYITSDQVPFSPSEPEENIQQTRNNISTCHEIILNAESDDEDIDEDIGDNDSESRPYISEELFTQLLDIYAKWQAMQLNQSVFSSNTVGIESKNVVNNLTGMPPIPSQLPTTQQQPPTWNFDINQPNSIINYHQPPPSGIQPSANVASQQPTFPQQYPPTNNMPNQPPTYQYSNLFIPPANQNKEFYPPHKESGLPPPQPSYNNDSQNRPYTESGFGRQSQQPQASTGVDVQEVGVRLNQEDQRVGEDQNVGTLSQED